MQDVLLIEKVHSLFHNTLQYDLSGIIRRKKVFQNCYNPSFCKFEYLCCRNQRHVLNTPLHRELDMLCTKSLGDTSSLFFLVGSQTLVDKHSYW